MAFCTGVQTITAILKIMIPVSLQFSEGLPAGTYTFFYMHIKHIEQIIYVLILPPHKQCYLLVTELSLF